MDYEKLSDASVISVIALAFLHLSTLLASDSPLTAGAGASTTKRIITY